MSSGVSAFVLRYLMTRTWVSVLAVLGTTLVTWVSIFFRGEWTWALLYGWRPVFHVLAPVGRVLGANIDPLTVVITVIGLSGGLAVAVDIASTRRRVLVAVLLVEATVLGVGVFPALVGSWVKPTQYSATVADVTWLLVVWGVPFVLLLLRAFGAWQRIEPPPRRYRTPRVWQTGA